MEDRQAARAAACVMTASAPVAFTDDQQRIGLCKLRGQGRAQRAGGKYAPVADAAARIDHGQRKILRQRWILQSIVHDDERRRPCVRANAAPATRSRATTVGADVREQKRLVADLGGNVAVSIHKLRAGDVSAITAAETKRVLAGVREHSCERHHGRCLAGAAEREIADAYHRHSGERAFAAMRLAAIAP